MCIYDYSKLKEKILDKYGCNCNFAIKLKVSERTLSLKLNNKRDFRQREMKKMCELLGISVTKIHEYFFTLKVQ